MPLSVSWPRNSLDHLISGNGSLKPLEALMPVFWVTVLEGIGMRTLEGVAEVGGLHLRYSHQLVRHDEHTVTLLTDSQMRRDYCEAREGVSVGKIEWAQVTSAFGRLSFAAIPRGIGHDVMLYGNHEEAPLRMHEELDQLRLSFRRGLAQRRRPRSSAVALAMSMAILALATVVQLRLTHYHHHHHGPVTSAQALVEGSV